MRRGSGELVPGGGDRRHSQSNVSHGDRIIPSRVCDLVAVILLTWREGPGASRPAFIAPDLWLSLYHICTLQLFGPYWPFVSARVAERPESAAVHLASAVGRSRRR